MPAPECRDERVVDAEPCARLVELAEDDAGPGLAPARGKRKRARDRTEQRGFPAAVPAGDGDALPAIELQVDRPEPEAAALDDRLLEPRDQLAAPRGRLELEAQLPRLERLLRAVEALERPLCLPHLRL